MQMPVILILVWRTVAPAPWNLDVVNRELENMGVSVRLMEPSVSLAGLKEKIQSEEPAERGIPSKPMTICPAK